MARIHDHADPFEIPVSSLGGSMIAIDAYWSLYRQIKGKRGRDGRAITNDDGEEIAHILGAFDNAMYFLENDVTPVYVFEGGMPDLKVEEHKRRRAKEAEARENYEAAVEAGDEEEMQRWGARADSLGRDQVDEVKHLYNLMGIPVFEAPSEADPQCAQMNQDGVVEYVYTEDFDHLLHGVNGLLRRFKNGTAQLVSRQQILDDLGYTHEQLVWRQIVAGCDYNNSPWQVGWVRAGNIIEGCRDFEEVIEATKAYCEGRDEWQWNPDRWRKVWQWFEEPDVEKDVRIHPGRFQVRDTRDYLTERWKLDSRQVQSRLREVIDG